MMGEIFLNVKDSIYSLRKEGANTLGELKQKAHSEIRKKTGMERW